MIPKIVHQAWSPIAPERPWKTKEVPIRFASCVESIKTHLSDWEYKLWTLESSRSLIEQKYSWFLDAYDNFDYDICRLDAARFFYLHAYGGVYFDVDVTINERFNIDNNNDCILFDYTLGSQSFINKGYSYIIDSFCMAADANHPLMKRAMKALQTGRLLKLSDLSETRENFNIMMVAGPGFLTALYTLYKDKYDIKVLTDKFIPGKLNLSEEDIKSVGDTWGIHHNIASWSDRPR